ncbi:alpha/beta hydrolase [Streptosporangium subroseum]|uniref:alpha/beta fold hydrolase n=1 Tax=Streptosporangium subroseum TaxID=106412 RepID=UPI00344964F2
MITTTSADGTTVLAADEGQGPAILVLHPGMDDGKSWGKVAGLLATRFRVVRLHRRQYRLDLTTGSPFSIAQEVDDVLAVAKMIGEPVLLVGHSSGGVVALEALLASPSTFAGAVLYEPALVIGPPLGGEAVKQARVALAAGKPGKAMAIWLRDVIRLPPWLARLGGAYVTVSPRYRALLPRQLDDNDALDQLGVRLDAYTRIETPTVLLTGDRSPAHLGERLDALARRLPHAEKVVLHGQGHAANQTASGEVARVIETLADRVLR